MNLTNKVGLKGPDSTDIGNVLDALKVFITGGNLSVSPIPGQNVVRGTEYLANGANKSMDVNGSSTPQEFSATVPAGQTWYVEAINFYFADGSIKDRTDYGSIPQLSNGLLVEYDIGGIRYTHSNVQNNMEVGLVYQERNDQGDGNNGLAADKPAYFGQSLFTEVVQLNAGDSIVATVRDNLNGLDDQRMSIDYWRAI